MCFVCGLENTGGLCLHFYDDGRDTVWSQFVVADQHQGFPGVVHGGISAAIQPALVNASTKASG